MSTQNLRPCHFWNRSPISLLLQHQALPWQQESNYTSKRTLDLLFVVSKHLRPARTRRENPVPICNQRLWWGHRADLDDSESTLRSARAPHRILVEAGNYGSRVRWCYSVNGYWLIRATDLQENPALLMPREGLGKNKFMRLSLATTSHRSNQFSSRLA
jgi:hypothetical protein